VTAKRYPSQTAAAAGLKACSICMHLNPEEHTTCQRCGNSISYRKKYSIQTTVALLLSALIFYIPANVYPIMVNTTLGYTEPSTIVQGIMLFIEEGSYFVAGVIFVASILIPLSKICAIFVLCIYTKTHTRISGRELTLLYKVTEFIGKWSMIDVFVVAILVALVHISNIMVIEPGVAARAFAIVVILTMFAAHTFDIRLIWDKQQDKMLD